MHGFSEDAMLECPPLDKTCLNIPGRKQNPILYTFRYNHGTLLRHCLLQDYVTSQLNIDANVGKDTYMNIEYSPGLTFQSLKLSTIEKFLTKFNVRITEILRATVLKFITIPIQLELTL